jgi:DNA-binding transcriptional ArsR family regulator
MLKTTEIKILKEMLKKTAKEYYIKDFNILDVAYPNLIRHLNNLADNGLIIKYVGGQNNKNSYKLNKTKIKAIRELIKLI